MDLIKEGNRILYLWESENASLEKHVEALKNRTNVTVNVENVHRLTLGRFIDYIFFTKRIVFL